MEASTEPLRATFSVTPPAKKLSSGMGTVRPMRTIVSKLRRKLGDDADNPTYIFTEPRVGYRMPKGEGQGRET